MKYKDIISRITGFSVPVFGVSWNPPEPEIAVARRVLAFLEDRRVLYNPYHMEMEYQCVDSVIEIRKFLTEILGEIGINSKLMEHLRAIRAACRQFLDNTGQRANAARTGTLDHLRMNSLPRLENCVRISGCTLRLLPLCMGWM